jgi:hypothetical protein
MGVPRQFAQYAITGELVQSIVQFFYSIGMELPPDPDSADELLKIDTLRPRIEPVGRRTPAWLCAHLANGPIGNRREFRFREILYIFT